MRLLKLIQTQTGWSQEQLGLELGISRYTVMRWLNGQIEPFPHKQYLIDRLADRVASATGTANFPPAA